jgi:hypothetical protein
MEFIKILKGHFWTHGVEDPIEYLASLLNVHEETIRVYCRQANIGIGTSENQLSPKTAAWLIEESFKVMHQNEIRNPVQEFFNSEGEKR